MSNGGTRDLGDLGLGERATKALNAVKLVHNVDFPYFQMALQLPGAPLVLAASTHEVLLCDECWLSGIPER